MEAIGFIGLGIMGRPMSKNLVGAGFAVLGYDVAPANMEAAVKNGVAAAKSVAEVASRCGIIIAMLPTPAICLDVALGGGGIAEHAKPGSLLLEMSSLSPMTVKEMHRGLAAKGISMMDAPVSGGEPKAADATLAIMLGGDKADYERALPVLKPMSASTILVGGIGAGCVAKLANQIMVGVNIAAMGEALTLAAKADYERALPVLAPMSASTILVGDVGAGCIAKLANQIMVGVNIAAMGEAFTLAAKAGVDPGLVFEAVKSGLAGSTVLNQKGPMILERNYTPGARMEIHIKDFVNVLDTAHSMSSPVPLTASVMEMMQSLKANGMGQIDHGGVVRFYEMIAGVEVKKGS